MEGLSVLFGTVKKLPEQLLLHRLFEENAKLCPVERGIGVMVNDGDVVTYAELNARSNRVARLLYDVITAKQLHRSSAGGKASVIVVDIAPSTQLLVALLATIKLGLAYVPVDGSSAINRVRYSERMNIILV